MPLAEDDDMVKAFPPDRANQPFRMPILPWRAGRGWPVTNAHGIEFAVRTGYDEVGRVGECRMQGFKCPGSAQRLHTQPPTTFSTSNVISFLQGRTEHFARRR